MDVHGDLDGSVGKRVEFKDDGAGIAVLRGAVGCNIDTASGNHPVGTQGVRRVVQADEPGVIDIACGIVDQAFVKQLLFLCRARLHIDVDFLV